MDKEKNNISNILKLGKKKLKDANITTWSLDAEILLSEILKIDRVKLLANNDIKITLSEKIKYDQYIDRRTKMEPVQYIINKSEFMALDFYVNKYVLIPRVETETLVELAIEYSNKNKIKKIIDMCTGSGCIAISLYYYCPCLKRILAVDISKKVLDVAKINYKKNKIGNDDEKIKFIESNMFNKISIEYENEIDMLICNPPYIKTLEICKLESNVKDYEPHIALDGREDGLYYYRKLAIESKKYLKIGGKIFMEIDYNNVDNIKKIFLKEGYKDICIKKDLSGFDRIVIVSR